MFDLEKIRSDFPLLQQQINGKPITYLDNSATTQKPQQVIDSIVDFYSNLNCNVHRSGHLLSEQASAAYESVRNTVKQFLNAEKTEEIIFTSGTTESINLVAQAFGNRFIQTGDDLITTEMEHHSNIVPWQMLCKRKKATLQVLPITDQGKLQVSKLPSLITNRTKLITVTAVSNVLGTINPLKEIITIAHEHDIPVLIDGAQAVQHMPIDVKDLNCDFLAFSGHKMYAGTGVGVLYGKEHLLKGLDPCIYGGGMISQVRFSKTTFADSPAKFEAGTRNISAVISLNAAIEYLNNIRIKNIQKHEHELLQYATQQLKNNTDITLYGTSPEKCGIISFNLKNIHHYDAGMILDRLGIAVRSGRHCCDPLMDHFDIPGCIRASFALYNSKKEIDRLISGIEKVQEMSK